MKRYLLRRYNEHNINLMYYWCGGNVWSALIEEAVFLTRPDMAELVAAGIKVTRQIDCVVVLVDA
jgi:hypothetical protein